jgi:hypothetical protein
MTRSTCFTAVGAVLVCCGTIACGPSDKSPLGGPYGGTETPPGPVTGSSPTGDDGGSAASSSGSAGSGGAGSSGGPGAGGGDAGTASGSGGGGSGGSGGGNASSGAGNGSSGGADAAAGGSGGQGGGKSPTWTAIFDAYLASGAEGHCVSCHNQASSPTASYAWLKSKGYISGTTSTIAAGGSCLTWFGGNMPPGGPASDANASADMQAWVVAGAQDN